MSSGTFCSYKIFGYTSVGGDKEIYPPILFEESSGLAVAEMISVAMGEKYVS